MNKKKHSTMYNVIMWTLGSAGTLALLAVLAICVCHLMVVHNAQGKLYEHIDSIPHSRVGLLLGTTPQTRIGGRKNLFFLYRIDAAEALYKGGKVDYILVSGAEHSLEGVNETQCMKDSLVARGVPADVILQDGKGLRTLDSVVRLRRLYGVSSFTIISQRFHNERAIYLAEHLNIDVDTVLAYNAQEPITTMSMLTYAREYFARVKMLLDIITNKQPANMEGDVPQDITLHE